MPYSRLTALAVSMLALVPGCSSNDSPKDAAVEGQTKPDLPRPDTSKKNDTLKPDTAPGIVPKISQIIPDSGFADRQTQVTIVGENFVQGMAVYVDGFPIHGTVVVNSQASASFPMPRNPEQGTAMPYTAHVSVLVNEVVSNQVTFRYILPTPMTSTFHGIIVTPSVNAVVNISSPTIEGKMTAPANDAGAAAQAEVGYGPVGTDAGNDSSWRWLPVPFTKTDAGESTFGGNVRFPTAGSFDLAFRFSIDGGKYWIFADTDDSDLVYNKDQAAKLTVTAAPDKYCLSDGDCFQPRYPRCDVPKNTCVQCLGDNDCTAISPELVAGQTCDTSKNLCYCKADAECTNNPAGAVCNDKPAGYCGCQQEGDCIAPKKCCGDPKTGPLMCCIPSP